MPQIPSPRMHRRPRLEIIPFIDIIFFLLATFMMVSLSMIRNAGIPVKLPRAASGLRAERRAETTITVTREGLYFVDREPLSFRQVRDRIERLARAEPSPALYLNADGDADFKNVVAVLDAARLCGIGKITIQTVPADVPSGGSP